MGAFEPLLDERGILAGAEFPFSPPDADAQREHLRQIVNWFWHELSHFIAALGRGDLWWACGQLEAMRSLCVNLMRIQHGAEAQDEPYEKLAKAIPVSELGVAANDVLSDGTRCDVRRRASDRALLPRARSPYRGSRRVRVSVGARTAHVRTA